MNANFRVFSFLLLLSFGGFIPFEKGLQTATPFQIDGIDQRNGLTDTTKFCGISLVSPPDSMNQNWTRHVRNINANWVAVMPYGFSYQGKPEVHFNHDRQWWGERMEGCRTMIRQAQNNGLSVMLKPMIYIPAGWAGDYSLETETQWQAWEENYSRFILSYAEIANEEKVGLFVIGTEFRIAVEARPAYWKKLIREIRRVYKGALTFAANWDFYERVPFWNELDIIGVNAYFPLVNSEIPQVDSLVMAWSGPLQQLESFSKAEHKKILITELGYRSISKPAWRQWEQESVPSEIGALPPAQVNAWEGFFKAAWQKSFISGCFLWNWYPDHSRSGGEGDSDYTPQNKPAEEVIRSWFARR